MNLICFDFSNFIFVLFLIVVCRAQCPPSATACYYISPDGDDRNDGLSFATPWRTNQNWVNDSSSINKVVIHPKSYIYYLNGTFEYEKHTYISNESGNKTFLNFQMNPNRARGKIFLQSFPDHNVRIDMNYKMRHIIDWRGGDLFLQNLRISNPVQSAVRMYRSENADYNRIENVIFDGIQTEHLNQDMTAVYLTSANVVIDNCVFRAAPDAQHRYFFLSYGHINHVNITNSLFYSRNATATRGIGLFFNAGFPDDATPPHTARVFVLNNRFVNMGDYAIGVCAQHSTIANNVIEGGAGVQIGFCSRQALNDIAIVDNTFYNAAFAMRVHHRMERGNITAYPALERQPPYLSNIKFTGNNWSLQRKNAGSRARFVINIAEYGNETQFDQYNSAATDSRGPLFQIDNNCYDLKVDFSEPTFGFFPDLDKGCDCSPTEWRKKAKHDANSWFNDDSAVRGCVPNYNRVIVDEKWPCLRHSYLTKCGAPITTTTTKSSTLAKSTTNSFTSTQSSTVYKSTNAQTSDINSSSTSSTPSSSSSSSSPTSSSTSSTTISSISSSSLSSQNTNIISTNSSINSGLGWVLYLIIVGAVLFVLLLIGGIVFYFKNRNSNSTSDTYNDDRSIENQTDHVKDVYGPLPTNNDTTHYGESSFSNLK